MIKFKAWEPKEQDILPLFAISNVLPLGTESKTPLACNRKSSRARMLPWITSLVSIVGFAVTPPT